MDLETAKARLNVLTEQAKAIDSSGQTASSSTGDQPTSWWSVTDAMTISSVVLIFGLLVLLMIALLIRSGKDTEAILRTFGTILIIVGAIFLVVAGYSTTQVAPVMGLLGTIAGYLLGKNNSKKE